MFKKAESDTTRLRNIEFNGYNLIIVYLYAFAHLG